MTTIDQVRADLREVYAHSTSETVLDVAVKWIVRTVAREVTDLTSRRAWIDAFAEDYDHGGYKLADALEDVWNNACGARSWRGRTCTLAKHEDPHHAAADGTRWMGDARESANGVALPDAVRRAYLALVELNDRMHDSPTDEEQREFEEHLEALYDVLFAACEITVMVEGAFERGAQAAAQAVWKEVNAPLVESITDGWEAAGEYSTKDEN
jgi:hypothetical protein